jgi:hypothetical protein
MPLHRLPAVLRRSWSAGCACSRHRLSVTPSALSTVALLLLSTSGRIEAQVSPYTGDATPPVSRTAALAAGPLAAALAAGASPEDALRRLLQHHSLVALYEHDRLVEVRVYGSGEGGWRARLEDTAPRVDRAVRSSRNPLGTRAQPAASEAELSVGAAIEALHTPDDTARFARALDVFRDVEAAPLEPLLSFAAAGQDPDQRAQVFEILVERGREDPRVRDLLHSVAAHDRDAEARDAASAMLDSLEAGR